MKAYMLQQYSYHMWANEQVIRHVESLPAEVFLKEVNLGFSSVAEALAHILAVDEIWFARLKGESPASLATRSFASVRHAGETLRELQQENLRAQGFKGAVTDYVAFLRAK